MSTIEGFNLACSFNAPVYAKLAYPNDGNMPSNFNMISLDKSNVFIEVIKKAEASDDIIIRLYEAHNRTTNVTLTYYKKFAKVIECNMMEEELEEIKTASREFQFTIKPLEIKTFKIIR